MELIIRNTTNQPIYDQIYSQIKAQIIAGKLSPGEALPSIRAAGQGPADLRHHHQAGLRRAGGATASSYTVAGKGCFVAEQNLDLDAGGTGSAGAGGRTWTPPWSWPPQCGVIRHGAAWKCSASC